MRASSGLVGRGRRALLALLAALPVLAGAPALRADDFAEARDLLVEQVVEHARVAAPLTGRAQLDPAILDAMRRLPRHSFVEAEAAAYAYLDIALPAAHGLRESQPFIVALMTELAAVGPADDVLILGVGGGYHAALASRLAAKVFSVDLDAAAVETVAARLAAMKYDDIELRAADPYDGWPELEHRFDAIIVRLAIDHLPPLLLRQLAPGGRLVAPIGYGDDDQLLTLVTRGQDDAFETLPILPVRFMRLPGGERL